MKSNSHLKSRWAGTIKGFNLCGRFSSFVILCRTCEAAQSFQMRLLRLIHCGPCMSRLTPLNFLYLFFLPCSLLPREVKRVTDQAITSIIKSCLPSLPLSHHHPPTPSWTRRIPPLSRSRAIMAAHGPNGLKGFHVS